jgi:hypothetical protein
MLSKNKLTGGYPSTIYDIPELLQLINNLNHTDILNNLIHYLTSLKDKIIQKKEEYEVKLKDDLNIDINGKSVYLENINKKYKNCMDKKTSSGEDVKQSTLADRMTGTTDISNNCDLIKQYGDIDNRNFIDKYISSNKQKNILEHKISLYTKIIDDLTKNLVYEQSGGGKEEEIQKILENDEIQKILNEYIELSNESKKLNDQITRLRESSRYSDKATIRSLKIKKDTIDYNMDQKEKVLISEYKIYFSIEELIKELSSSQASRPLRPSKTSLSLRPSSTLQPMQASESQQVWRPPLSHYQAVLKSQPPRATQPQSSQPPQASPASQASRPHSASVSRLRQATQPQSSQPPQASPASQASRPHSASVSQLRQATQSQSSSVSQSQQALDKKPVIPYVVDYISNLDTFCKNNKMTPSLKIFIREILEYLYMIFSKKLLVDNQIEGIPPLNIIITGTPGIGKSYIAGQISDFLSLTMLLPIGKLIMIKKPDVIGQYIGQTAPRAYEKLLSNIGNICFIDEAYSFAGKKRDNGFDMFGKEFIDALVDFTSEYTGLISIIAAGYKKEMTEQFINVNDGIDRRFPIKINIERYHIDTFIDLFNRNSKLDELCKELGFTDDITKTINNYLINFIKHNYLMFNDQYFYIFNTHGYNVHIYSNDNNIIYKIIIAYLLSKCDIKHGDLFINQFSDLLKFINIIKTVLVIKPLEDIELKIKQIIESYIKTKTNSQFELLKQQEKLSEPENKTETYMKYYEKFHNSKLTRFFPILNFEDFEDIKLLFKKTTDMAVTPNNVYINLSSNELITPAFKVYIIEICNYYLDKIDNSSDFILFTKEELKNVIRMYKV